MARPNGVSDSGYAHNAPIQMRRYRAEWHFLGFQPRQNAVPFRLQLVRDHVSISEIIATKHAHMNVYF